MQRGFASRSVARTKMNERSSRSHSIVTVIVEGVSLLDSSRSHGCLHLIDLAGMSLVLLVCKPCSASLGHSRAQDTLTYQALGTTLQAVSELAAARRRGIGWRRPSTSTAACRHLGM